LTPSAVSGDWGQALRARGFTDEMKLELYPLGANQMLMRIENIADTFDTNGQVVYQTVDVQGLADDLFAIANN
jgi:hypothetical protein